MDNILKDKVVNNFLNKENNLSEFATKSSESIRMITDNDDIRPSYYHDIDRIIHALSYTRYMNKTQVFSFKANDHISKRIVHVQLVSKIARTIARALNLNEDLTEAIALGHDIGHTPLGHTGEAILNEISLKYTGLMFNHNIQSVRTYLNLENNFKGVNLTIQTLDGIMCHNGEILCNIYEPKLKTKDEFLEEYELCYKDKDILKKIRPMTLEGCIVRISDIIGYIGRDIEDAINLGVLTREDIPLDIRNVLGTSNREIVNTIILDIIENSIDKPYIKMSEEVFKAIFDLKKFNYENVYAKANTIKSVELYREGMNKLFVTYLNDINNRNYDSIIFKSYLLDVEEDYINKTTPERIVIDFIAGMTDEFFIKAIDYSEV